MNINIQTEDGGKVSLIELLNSRVQATVSEDATVGTIDDDVITETSAHSEIYGFYGNDVINTAGAESIIVGGEGDDVINTKRYAIDKFVFNNGDGQDIIKQDYDNFQNMPFIYSPTQIDYMEFTGVDKNGFNTVVKDNDIVISYNDGQDSVTIKDYLLNADNTRDFVIKTKDGQEEVKADSVILAIGYNPNPIAQKGKKVHVVGDANKVGNLRTVIWGVWDVCKKI
jgi:hypothetical protein